MNKIIVAILGIIAIVGTAFGVQEYLDNRYVQEFEARSTLANLPTGAIVAWYRGDTEKFPTGWVLCDGKNGTPDLRGKFLRGEHPDFGTTGGRTSHNVPDQEIKVFGIGWVQGRTEKHPVGGPEEFQSWRSRNWHILISRGIIPGQEIDLIPPYHEVTFIMKVGET